MAKAGMGGFTTVVRCEETAYSSELHEKIRRTASAKSESVIRKISSRVSEEDLLTKDRSDPRNPVLLRMFRYVSLAEEAGTGLPKVLRIWRQQGLKLPSLASDTERYEFQVTLKLVHLLSLEDRAWLSWCAKTYSAKGQPGLPGVESLSQDEQLVLIQARTEDAVNNAAVQALTGLHRADVTPLLVGLRDRGLLQQESARRWAVYRLPDAIRQAYHDGLIKKSGKEVGVVVKKKAAIIRETPHVTPHVTPHDTPHVTPQVVRLLKAASKPRSRGELQELLELKDRMHFQRAYLDPLMKAGWLEMTLPGKPKSRRQRYRTTAAGRAKSGG